MQLGWHTPTEGTHAAAIRRKVHQKRQLTRAGLFGRRTLHHREARWHAAVELTLAGPMRAEAGTGRAVLSPHPFLR